MDARTGKALSGSPGGQYGVEPLFRSFRRDRHGNVLMVLRDAEANGPGGDSLAVLSVADGYLEDVSGGYHHDGTYRALPLDDRGYLRWTYRRKHYEGGTATATYGWTRRSYSSSYDVVSCVRSRNGESVRYDPEEC